MTSEKTPLVSDNPTPTAYFLDGVHKRKPSSIMGELSFDAVDAEEVDNMPKGTSSAEFLPRSVIGFGNSSNKTPTGGKGHRMKAPSVGGGWLDYIVADSWKSKPTSFSPEKTSKDNADEINIGAIGTLLIPRKVPIKVEPKVHFANERTFLAWLHVVLILAAASMTIVAYGRDDSIVNQLYGIILLPVSVAYIFYALWQYLRRTHLINHREPGPYIDVVGPVTLTIILMASIIAQFCAKLHSVVYEA